MLFWQQVAGIWQAFAVSAESTGRSLQRVGLQFEPVRFDGMLRVALLTRDAMVRVNGAPLVAGLKLLCDRDEILAGTSRFYFSAEAPPEVKMQPMEEHRVRCGVCRMPIQPGDQVVVCPRCGMVFHQLDERDGRPEKKCWTHRESCLRCGHPTSMTGEAAWRPDKEADCD